MSLASKTKTSLDETRMTLIAAEIFLGFQFNAAFQEGFEELGPNARRLSVLALLLIVTTIAFLITPSMEHRIVEGGHASDRIQRLATKWAGRALLLFAVTLGLDVFIASSLIVGNAWAAMTGGSLLIVARMLWFGLEFRRREKQQMRYANRQEQTPLATRIEQMLTEARVMLPGVQALLGFDLVVAFMRGFEQLPDGAKLVHLVALTSIAIAMILLIAPAAFHRLAFGGNDSEEFHRIGSLFVIIAPLPLSLSIACNVYVAVLKITGSGGVGGVAAMASLLVPLWLWYAGPWLKRGDRFAGWSGFRSH